MSNVLNLSLRNAPEYRCIKKVRGRQIVYISGNTVRLEGEPCPLRLPKGFFERHAPKKGGYLVLYKDGYVSYSPKDAFDGGYVKEG